MIGYFSRCSASAAADGPCLGDAVPRKIIEDASPDITRRIVAMMDADSISRFHRYMRRTAAANLARLTPSPDLILTYHEP